MGRFLYQPHHIDFIDSCCGEMSIPDVARLFHFVFGRKLTPAAVKCVATRYGISVEHKDSYTRELKYNAEQIDWIKTAYRTMTPKQMCQPFNERFGTNETWNQLRAFIHNHGIQSGRTGRFEKGSTSWNKEKKGWTAGGRSAETRFQKGNIPDNHKPVGTEVIDSYGYRKRKVAEPNQWEFVHRLVWEKHNDPIPNGKFVRFIDGDKANCKLNNLILIDRAANAILNRWVTPLSKLEPEVRKSMVGVAMLRSAISARGSTNGKEAS
ncbi:HNH endonuclease signature motif containing protein [Idiomarina sp.]|uniref:HNH endonuclease signature motif containing protein n=1 Tax=Idiomarina sp. TaxID=1874361 RepID=UPI0025C2F5F5|nr:HNH endonuclease signature motif containing protein [Idiomarina sp.]